MKQFYKAVTNRYYFISLFICAIATNTFGQIPTISNFSPTSGPVGTMVTISGANFNTTSANNTVFFGATRATVTSATSTTLTVTVPAGATYDYISVLKNGNGLLTLTSSKFIPTYAPSSSTINASDFALPVYFYSGQVAGVLESADLDGDGKPDFAMAGELGIISIFRNTSTIGTISCAPSINLPARSTAYNTLDISVGDLDGDGKPDLVSPYTILSDGDPISYVSVYRNTSTPGNISFANREDFGETLWFAGKTRISDVDGDGRQDIILLNSIGFASLAFLNTSNPGTISFADPIDLNVPNVRFSTFQSGDLDGDKKPDLILPHFLAQSVSVMRNTSMVGSIGFAQNVTFPLAPQWQWEDVSLGDLDGDGKQDIATVSNQFRISVIRNTSTLGNLAFESSYTINTAENSYWLPLGDINGDGKVDMLTNGTGYNKLLLYRNESTPGNLNFAEVVELTGALTDMRIADVDGDGKPELLGCSSGTLVIRRNTTTGLGIEETNQTSNLSVYPNPAKDILTIKSNQNINFKSIEILDVSGRVLQTINPDVLSEVNVDVSHLSSGNYVLKVTSESGTTVKKFIKM
ncbi:MAG: FG-GAP-like repeat-containing protein [Gelidibacter sp.]